MKIKFSFALAMFPLLCLDHAHCGALKKYFSKDDQQQEDVAHSEATDGSVAAEGGHEAHVDGGVAGASVEDVHHAEMAGEPEHVEPSPPEKHESAEAVPMSAHSAGDIEAETAEKKKEIKGDPVVLKIGRTSFKRSQILADVKLIPPQLLKSIPADRLFGMLLDQKMSTYLMVEQAKKAGMDRTADFNDKLTRMKEELLARMYLMKEISPKAENESALRGEYAKYQSEFKKGKEHQLWHIMVATEADAKALIADLVKGADFAKLAKDKSMAPSKENGGDEGYVQLDMLPSDVRGKLLALRNGEFVKEPLKVGTTFHVFKVGDSRETSPQKFEDIKDMLKQMIVQKTIMDLITKLEKQYQVEKFNEDGTPYIKTLQTGPAPAK